MGENRREESDRKSGGWLKRLLSTASADALADDAAALCRRGNEAKASGRYQEAADLYRKALEHRPNDAEIRSLLGGALNKARRPKDAEAVLRAGLAATPDHVATLIELAAALGQQNRWVQALPYLERALKLAPDMGEPHVGMGAVNLELGRADEAVAAFRRAVELLPNHATVHSCLAFAMNYSTNFTQAQILAEHKRYGDRHGKPVVAPAPDRTWPRRLRIGYVSPDFRAHVVSAFMLPIIARHDRERFEVYCYYVFEETDPVTDGFIELADRWRHCLGSAEQIAERIREDRIDILVDLAGHSRENALEVFALRPAPVQVSYLGYPNTTGLRAIDYRISDAKADPPGEADAHYVEKLVRLPRTFVCYRPGPGLDVAPPPVLQGAPFTFGSFNNLLKVSPKFISAAARVLEAVPGSRLLLKDRRLASEDARQRIEAGFAQHGIGPERLVLKGWEPTAQSHLRTYDAVDVALDTFPYNGTTTTCEALWMGVPVVSLRGDRHASRVGESLLRTVGLDEFVAQNEDEYVSIAVRLASDRDRLATLRQTMRERLRASPLMDEHGFVRELEACYLEMWQEKLREAPPARLPDARAVLDEVAAARAQGRLDEAVACCARHLRWQPNDGAVLEALWNLCHETGEHAAAVEHLGAALAVEPDSARFRYMLGCTLEDAGRMNEAAVEYRRVLELEPSHAKAANNLGCVLELAGNSEGAKRSYDAAIRADPRLAVALANRGNLHRSEGRYDEGERDLAAAIRIDGTRADWHAARAECLAMLGRFDEAEQAQRDGLALDPDAARLHFGLGTTLVRLGRPAEAEAHLRRATQLAPDLHEAHSALLLALHCTRGNDAEALFREHERFAAEHAGSAAPLLEWPAGDLRAERRLRLGYLVPDLGTRPLAAFLAPLLGKQDRRRFHVCCYFTTPRPEASVSRLRELADQWRDIHALSDFQAARQIRDDGIDILVDLAGHAEGGRPLLLAQKPAPVQVSWLGYPSTTGLKQVDYWLSDERAAPAGATERYFVERIERLPRGMLCYAPPADLALPDAPPALKRGHITLACFDDLAKISEDALDLWARTLAAVPASRLLLGARALSAESARRALLERLARRGIPAERVVIAPAEPSLEHDLARYAEADIVMDTFPYGGTMTTCDALYMGVPVVTLAGATPASRMGASILGRAGLDDLVTLHPEAFVERVRALAGDLDRLAAMRAGLRERVKATLMDAQGFAADLEQALLRMWDASRPAREPRTVAAPAGGLRLHVGGREVKEGWKILNAQAGEGVDYVGDCADLGRFPDGSVEEIYASHVLEHLGYHSHLPRTLKEFHRVLRPGGIARISVPDFEVLCRLFLDPAATLEERFHCMRIVFGGQLDEYDFHRVGLTHEFLSRYLYAAGFSRVERVTRFGLFRDASELVMRGQLISLNVVAYK